MEYSRSPFFIFPNSLQSALIFSSDGDILLFDNTWKNLKRFTFTLLSTVCSCIALGILKHWAYDLAVQGTSMDVALEYLIIFNVFMLKNTSSMWVLSPLFQLLKQNSEVKSTAVHT